MSNIDEKAKNNFTIEILDIDECQGCFYSLASLCVVSWYALNVCVGKNFSVCSRFF